MCYFALLLGQKVGRQALLVAAAVVWEAASTMPDPSARQHKSTQRESHLDDDKFIYFVSHSSQ